MLVLSLLLVVNTFVIVRMDYASPAPTSERQRKSDVNVRMVTWVNNPPYYLERKTTLSDKGIGPKIIESGILNLCPKDYVRERIVDNDSDHLPKQSDIINIVTNKNTTQIKSRLNITANSNEIIVLSATSFNADRNEVNAMFQQRILINVKSAAVIVRTADIILLTKFVNGIFDCLAMISFAVFLAIVLSTIVWLIEYMNDNPSFPDTFGKGLWVSFWYCFVTMTTVGYGDKVPKHFLTRFLILIWMMFGLMLTAIITATVIESVDKEVQKVGKNVGVILNSTEQNYVHKRLSAEPKAYESYNEILAALISEEIEAALIDTVTAAFILESRPEFSIEETIDVNFNNLAYVYTPEELKEKYSCGEQSPPSHDFERVSDRLRMNFMRSFTVKHYKARAITELFDRSDRGFMIYLIIFDAAIIAIAIICEVVAKIRQKRAENNENFKSSGQYKRIKNLEKTFETIIANMLAEEANHFRLEEKKNPSYFVMNNVNK